MRIFLKNRNSGSDSGPTIYCDEPGCQRGTKHGKSFCAEHIDRMDYARYIADQLNRRDDEVDKLAAGETLPRDAHLVHEAFSLLWEHQSVSAPGLTRHIAITHGEAEQLLRSLEAHGLASIARTSRGVEATCAVGPDTLPDLDTL